MSEKPESSSNSAQVAAVATIVELFAMVAMSGRARESCSPREGGDERRGTVRWGNGDKGFGDVEFVECKSAEEVSESLRDFSGVVRPSGSDEVWNSGVAGVAGVAGSVVCAGEASTAPDDVMASRHVDLPQRFMSALLIQLPCELPRFGTPISTEHPCDHLD
jgi:hypothetical protein